MGRTATTGEFKDGSFKIKLTTSDMVSNCICRFVIIKIAPHGVDYQWGANLREGGT